MLEAAETTETRQHAALLGHNCLAVSHQGMENIGRGSLPLPLAQCVLQGQAIVVVRFHHLTPPNGMIPHLMVSLRSSVTTEAHHFAACQAPPRLAGPLRPVPQLCGPPPIDQVAVDESMCWHYHE